MPRRKRLSDIKSYMKFNESEQRFDPFSIADDFIEEYKQFSPNYNIRSEDIGRLDTIATTIYQSPNYEEIIGIINRIGDQFTDMEVDKAVKILPLPALKKLISETEVII